MGGQSARLIATSWQHSWITARLPTGGSGALQRYALH